MMELVFFLFFAIAAVLSALSVILQKNIIYSALSLIVVIASLGGLFLLQHAAFLAILQIVIYAGAIMALFLFVIMMVDPKDEFAVPGTAQTRIAIASLLLIAGVAIWAVSSSVIVSEPLSFALGVRELARVLFTRYVFPFEAISILIISSVIGALYIARKEDA